MTSKPIFAGKEALWRRAGPWAKSALRRGLARIPLLPIPARLSGLNEEPVSFWWSYASTEFDFCGGVFEYRGPNRDELLFLTRFLKSGMCFLDIGAYHGLYSVVAAKQIGPEGRLVIFEPSQRETRRARMNLLFNRARASVEPLAVSSQAGPQPFYIVLRGYTTMSSLRQQDIDFPVKQCVVNAITLDDYCVSRGIHDIDVIKVDVEGGELALFQGARRVLTCTRPLIICEVLDWVTRAWGYPACDIIKHLDDYGFEWFEFKANGNLELHCSRTDYPELKNYLAVPKEKTQLVDHLLVGA